MTKSEAIKKAQAVSKRTLRVMAALYDDDYQTYRVAEWDTFIVGPEGYLDHEIIEIFDCGARQ